MAVDALKANPNWHSFLSKSRPSFARAKASRHDLDRAMGSDLEHIGRQASRF
jgi:hypothetical protein